MSIELKVKAKSLAAEARIIRKEERKQLGYARYLARATNQDSVQYRRKYRRLRAHRVGVVRQQSRLTGLARAYLRGDPYKKVENPVRKPLGSADIQAIAKMVRTYGPGYPDLGETCAAIEEWVT